MLPKSEGLPFLRSLQLTFIFSIVPSLVGISIEVLLMHKDKNSEYDSFKLVVEGIDDSNNPLNIDLMISGFVDSEIEKERIKEDNKNERNITREKVAIDLKTETIEGKGESIL